jgi:hypothetical protein
LPLPRLLLLLLLWVTLLLLLLLLLLLHELLEPLLQLLCELRTLLFTLLLLLTLLLFTLLLFTLLGLLLCLLLLYCRGATSCWRLLLLLLLLWACVGEYNGSTKHGPCKCGLYQAIRASQCTLSVCHCALPVTDRSAAARIHANVAYTKPSERLSVPCLYVIVPYL